MGDSTGFPMDSNLMVFSNGNLAATYGNYPNPFHAGSESTTIEFYLLTNSTVSLDIYDVTGNKVISLLKNVSLPAGDQKIPWDGKNGMGALVLNGVYYAQLNVNGNKLLTKIAVAK
jgi:flagellar hook assembly protein FlgD